MALIDRKPEPDAFKRICGHFIQSSAVPTLERLGLLVPIERAGGVRTRFRIWTRWGWIEPPPSDLPASVNMRRERLDPLLRSMAAETPGVDLRMGLTADALAPGGVIGLRERSGSRIRLSAPLVVGADGRDSRVGRLAGLRARTARHGRFSYGGYYEGPDPAGAPNGSLWLLDPQVAAAFPTDGGLTLYACFATKDRLPEFRRDLDGALTAFIANLPDAPPILESRRVGAINGKLEMPNVLRGPIAPGLALAGDAALATDPVWGVGCGWAFQMGEWLADSVAPALAGEEPLRRGLHRYRRRITRSLRPHALLADGYAGGRRFSAAERFIFAAGARDERVAARLEAFGTRSAGPESMLSPRVLGPAIAANARATLRRERPVPLGSTA